MTVKRKTPSTSTQASKKVKQEVTDHDDEAQIKTNSSNNDQQPTTTTVPKSSKNNNKNNNKKEKKNNNNQNQNHGTNSKKEFTSVEMKSLQFPKEYQGTPIGKLLDATQKHGHDHHQYCSLSVFVEEKEGERALVLAQRYKHAILANASSVEMFQTFRNAAEELTTIHEYKCNRRSNIIFEPQQNIKGSTSSGSQLAWRIWMADGSFDIHVTKDKFVKTVQNNSKKGYLSFKECFSSIKLNTAEDFIDGTIRLIERPETMIEGIIEKPSELTSVFTDESISPTERPETVMEDIIEEKPTEGIIENPSELTSDFTDGLISPIEGPETVMEDIIEEKSTATELTSVWKKASTAEKLNVIQSDPEVVNLINLAILQGCMQMCNHMNQQQLCVTNTYGALPYQSDQQDVSIQQNCDDFWPWDEAKEKEINPNQFDGSVQTDQFQFDNSYFE